MANLKAFKNNKSLSSDGRAIFMVFFGAIIAIVLIGTFADSIYPQITTYSHLNHSITKPAVNTTVDLPGRELIGTATVTNSTKDTISEALVFTGTSATTGLRSVQIFLNDTAFGEATTETNVSYAYKPSGYLNISGARGMASLIVIMSALAILVFVIVVFIKHGSLGRLIGRQ